MKTPVSIVFVAIVFRNLCVLSALALAGCVASVGPVTVAPGEPGERLEVSAAVKKNSTVIRSVVLQTRPAGGTFTDVGDMTETDGKFRGRINPLGQGDFEAKVLVTYTPPLQAANRTASATRAFSLSFPPGTFDFGGGGLDGWTFRGLFRTSPSFPACPPEELARAPHFSRARDGWPGLSPNGSLQVVVSPACYPDTAGELAPGDASGFWEIHLVSPLLDGNAAWQGARGVSFRMSSGLPVQAIATVVVQGVNGQDETVSPLNAQGALDFTEIGGAFAIVAKTDYIPDRPIRRILIRIFGRPADVAGIAAASLRLDVVSPLR